VADVLFWLALVAYIAAAVAYVSPRFERAGRWGVRVGWLAQTALLAAQAARADGFPWDDWAGSLNLFVWLVVGAYLIWGCKPRYRLLGLVVMPVAAALFAVARAGGGTSLGARSDYSNLFLILHVGLVLAAFAGFTLAAGLSGLYLWQARRLKRHSSDILKVRMPSLVVLDRVARRTIVVATALFTLGIAVGLVRLGEDGGGVDALMAVTLVAWTVYAGYSALRLHGRIGAWVALAGFALVIVARLGLQLTHFS
jgi:ABC-type uncharacterized transport system permease subunit